MARAYWSGQISISLVSFAVEIYPATSPARRYQFHRIERSSGQRIHYQNLAAGPAEPESDTEPDEEIEPEPPSQRSRGPAATAASSAPPPAQKGFVAPPPAPLQTEQKHVVAKSEVVKGYEYEKGKYAIIEPEELKRLRLSRNKSLDIVQFSPAAQIIPALYDKPYYVVPKKGPQSQAFAIVREGMVETHMVGLGEIVFAGREHLVALAPPTDAKQLGMMLYTLRFADELRDPAEYFDRIEPGKPDATQLTMAKQLIQTYTQPFELEKFHDSYEVAVRELVEAKLKNQPLPTELPERARPKPVDLMEALRLSLAAKGAPAAAASAAPAKAGSKKAGIKLVPPRKKPA